jgi:3-phenylpropionate/trans-cinnamate dioxygenase ferredoxin reductase component
MAAEGTYVIVGGGHAGGRAAEALRKEGFGGRLVVFGEEPDRPYERPPLSKEFLRGEADDAPYLQAEGFYAEQEIELETATTVTEIDRGGSRVLLGGGGSLGYDRLLLATGAEPRRLDVPGGELEGVHYLRSLADSRRLGEQLKSASRVVVVGSGWIGAEVAASARALGCEVTMIEMSALPLERVLGPEVGRIYMDLHRANGVEFIPETTVDRFEGAVGVERVVTRDGAEIEADLVAVGIGVVPRTGLGQAAGLDVDNGILTDAGLRTSEESIFAAGDVANAWHPFYGRRLRVEHWANAERQGPVAARAMLGKPASYEEIPYFFSDQYDTGMEYVGYATEWDRVVFRGDPASRELIAFWLSGGRVVAGLNMNVWDVSDRIRGLIISREQVDAEALGDPGIPLEELMPGAGLEPASP